jgi:hypothetical protein
MADPISGAALVIAILSGISSIINSLHVRKCKGPSGCDLDCREKQQTPPNSPDGMDKINLDGILKKRDTTLV